MCIANEIKGKFKHACSAREMRKCKILFSLCDLSSKMKTSQNQITHTLIIHWQHPLLPTYLSLAGHSLSHRHVWGIVELGYLVKHSGHCRFSIETIRALKQADRNKTYNRKAVGGGQKTSFQLCSMSAHCTYPLHHTQTNSDMALF